MYCLHISFYRIWRALRVQHQLQGLPQKYGRFYLHWRSLYHEDCTWRVWQITDTLQDDLPLRGRISNVSVMRRPDAQRHRPCSQRNWRVSPHIVFSSQPAFKVVPYHRFRTKAFLYHECIRPPFPLSQFQFTKSSTPLDHLFRCTQCQRVSPWSL